ncbi:MAG: anhydro-N-acetylmuramic acid kinase [Flavobacteriaceae bacterium]|nr:anhydro-N-acetylmuramic acid kinase [Flavobacteriaceae bacterium]
MKKYDTKVLGVMSGTSLDGVDVAQIHFTKDDQWHFEIVNAETIPYPHDLKKKLQEAINFDQISLEELNERYTGYLAEIISAFIKKYNITNLDGVCSHGHTIKHEPENKYTLQIGNLPQLAGLLNLKVVCDFRVQDVALGGQGAPLVPVGDELLFPKYDYCLNLGGFANISTLKEGKRIAYDICPVNIVLNKLTEKLGFPYDDEGKIAASGHLIPELLKRLNALPFYTKLPPKSLGLEWVTATIFPLVENSGHKTEDLLCTFTEHVAMQLAENFREGASVLTTGGGTFNSYLLKRLAHYRKIEIIIPAREVIEYKEALIFGLLGVLKLRGEVNCLRSVTGARKDHSSGMIYPV